MNQTLAMKAQQHPVCWRTSGQSFNAEERMQLLDLARRTLQAVVGTGESPDISISDLPGKSFEPRCCFVTLTRNGALRGCIGSLIRNGPLFSEIMRNTEGAATGDPRFPPVYPSEVDEIEIEINVLTEPKPLIFNSPKDLLAKLRPRVDGVVLKIGNRVATCLPKVWDMFPDKDTFMSMLAQKAGCDPTAWRDPDTAVFTYQVERFKEAASSTP